MPLSPRLRCAAVASAVFLAALTAIPAAADEPTEAEPVTEPAPVQEGTPHEEPTTPAPAPPDSPVPPEPPAPPEPPEPPAEPVPAPGPLGAFVTTSRVNFRTGPGTTHPILHTLALGTPVTARGHVVGNWWRVTTKGKAGWIHSNRLVAAPTSGFLTTIRVNLRSGPGTANPRLALLPAAAPVTALGQVQGNWWQVRAEGRVGWVSISHLSGPATRGLITSGRVNFRSGPSTSQPIILTLAAGTPVTYRARAHGSWWRVTTKGTSGWVHVNYLRAAPATGYHATTGLNLRSGPGLSHAQILTLPKHTALRATGRAQGNWWQVTARARTGWVSISHVARGHLERR